jgi:HEAT repeat protein
VKSLLLVLALLAPAQSKGADARISALVAALGDASNAQARSNAYMALLGEKSPAAIPLLVEALPRFDLQGQEYGLWVLGAYPPEESRVALHKLAGETSPLLELGAATILWNQGDHGQIDHIVKPIARKDAPPDVRRAMIRRIGMVKDPRLCAAVRGWLVPETDAVLLEDALFHLLVVEDPEARAKTIELASTPGLPPASRVACATFLLALGEDAQGEFLAESFLADGGVVVWRLARFFDRTPRLPDALLAALAQIAEKPDSSAALPAVRVLAQHAGQKQVPTLERLMGSPNLLVAKAALDALQERGVAISHETLVRMLDSKEGQRVLSAADALRRADDLSGFERVLEVLKAGGAEKAEALRVLSKFRKRASVMPLVDALDDADSAVRLAAEQGLYDLLRNLYPYRRFEFAAGGFLAQAAPDKRAEGVRAIRAWCAANVKP